MPSKKSVKKENFKKFLVTGASGFVGTHMVKLLVDKGCEVIACDLEGTDGGKYESLGVKFAPVDITSKHTLDGLMEDVDVVMHVAAIFNYDTPWKQLRQVNVKGTRNVCEAAAEQGVKKLVYFSSCDIYGKPAKMPADEHCKIRTYNDYGESKFLGEREAFKVSVARGLNVTVLRPATLYGPGSTYGAIVLINMLYHGWLPGMPGGGKAHVHLVHVKDVVNAAYFLSLHPHSTAQEYNLSDDTPTRIKDVLELAARELDVPLPRAKIPRFVAETAAPVVELFARVTGKSPLFTKSMLPILFDDHVIDNSRIKALGYELLYPDVMKGLQEVFQWYKENDVLKQNFVARRIRLKEVFE